MGDWVVAMQNSLGIVYTRQRGLRTHGNQRGGVGRVREAELAMKRRLGDQKQHTHRAEQSRELA